MAKDGMLPPSRKASGDVTDGSKRARPMPAPKNVALAKLEKGAPPANPGRDPSLADGSIGTSMGAMTDDRYEALRDRCVGLMAEGRQRLLEIMWQVGKQIVEALGSGRQEYGAHVVHRLAGDLGMDHTNVTRAIQFYETYPHPQIVAAPQQLPGAKAGDNAHNLGVFLSWERVKMLLPLDAALRAEMEKRLASGELRTDEQLREAILRRRIELGLVDEDVTSPRLEGVKDMTAEKAATLLRRVAREPKKAYGLLTLWVCDLGRRSRQPGMTAEQRIEDKKALGDHIRRCQAEYEER